ncbi:MAG: hypothetical protein ACYC3I_19090 [Gemmataceae bacterium]
MKNARLGLIFSLLLSVFAVFIATIGKAAPAPARPKTGVLILDNCDPDFRGKENYEDNMTSITSYGKIGFRVSGLNNAETTGCSHMVAADPKRGWIWVLENVGNRIHKYDRTGKELLVVKDIEALALAVDPDSGALWVLTAKETIYGDKTAVFDAEGRQVATYNVSGYDIAYDPKSKSFWIAGPNLAKVSKAASFPASYLQPGFPAMLSIPSGSLVLWTKLRGKDRNALHDCIGELPNDPSHHSPRLAQRQRQEWTARIGARPRRIPNRTDFDRRHAQSVV